MLSENTLVVGNLAMNNIVEIDCKKAAFTRAVAAHNEVKKAEEALRRARELEHEAVLHFLVNYGQRNDKTESMGYDNGNGSGWIIWEDGKKYLPQYHKVGRGGKGESRAFLREPWGARAERLK